MGLIKNSGEYGQKRRKMKRSTRVKTEGHGESYQEFSIILNNFVIYLFLLVFFFVVGEELRPQKKNQQ